MPDENLPSPPLPKTKQVSVPPEPRSAPAEVKPKEAPSAPKTKGTLFSRLGYPVTITINGEQAVINPHAKLDVEKESIKDELPNGLTFVPTKA